MTEQKRRGKILRTFGYPFSRKKKTKKQEGMKKVAENYCLDDLDD